MSLVDTLIKGNKRNVHGNGVQERLHTYAFNVYIFMPSPDAKFWFRSFAHFTQTRILLQANFHVRLVFYLYVPHQLRIQTILGERYKLLSSVSFHKMTE
jgi:hypothetical protein